MTAPKTLCIYLSLGILLLFACGQSKKAPASSQLFPYHDKAQGITFFAHYKYKDGYIDVNGNRVIDNTFIHAEPFTEGLGCVAVKTKHGVLYGYIDSTANFVIEPRFKDARPFHNGRALVWQSDETDWGVIDRQGRFLTDKIYAVHSTDYDNGHCIAYEKIGTREASKLEDAIVGVFSLGLLNAPDDPIYNCYSIDLNGHATLLGGPTLSTQHGDTIRWRRQNGLGLYWTDGDSRFGFKKISFAQFDANETNYSETGTPFIAPVYKDAQDFQYGYARVVFDNGDKGYIDTTGKVVVRFREDQPY